MWKLRRCLQVPETAKEVSDHLNEAARTVGERAVPAADDMSANIMGHAKNFEEALPAAADDVSANLRETAKAAGEQAKIGAHEVRFVILISVSTLCRNGEVCTLALRTPLVRNAMCASYGRKGTLTCRTWPSTGADLGRTAQLRS